ncbi:alpha-galactosidase [Auraticoccus cholistanensis]
MSSTPVPVGRPPSPPRGWNSWDCYGTTVTEEEVLANARFMAEHLLPHGWDTVVVDIQWYAASVGAGGYHPDADVQLDAWGRPVPEVSRFPSAADGRGFAPLADQVHALGLRFGVHIMRGIPRRAAEQRLPVLGTQVTAADLADPQQGCSWNPDNAGVRADHPDAAAWYASVAQQLAGWGVDFVKADDMLWPYRAWDIEALSTALAATGRPIELSLSPGVDVSTTRAEHLARHATMWRISNDLWDSWDDVTDMFARLARWAPLSRPGAFADADMLPLGRVGIRAEVGTDRTSRLTWAEQRTLLTLWGIGRSPFFVGGDLPTSPPETIAMLQNPLLLAVNFAATEPREVLRERDHVLWTARLGEELVVAVFAVGPEPLRRTIPLASVAGEGRTRAREAWTGAEVDVTDGIAVDLASHDAALLLLS